MPPDAPPAHTCRGYNRDPHPATPEEMVKNASRKSGLGERCRTCDSARRRDRRADPYVRDAENAALRRRYRADAAFRARQIERAVGRWRRAKAARYRTAARSLLGVVVGWAPNGDGWDAVVSTQAGTLKARAVRGDVPRARPRRVPREPLYDGSFVRVLTRVPRRAGQRLSRSAHLLRSFSPETAERLLALHRAAVWAQMTDHDREAAGSITRHFAGLDFVLARAATLARRERAREDAMDEDEKDQASADADAAEGS